jgi:hypothetical protein
MFLGVTAQVAARMVDLTSGVHAEPARISV